MLTMRTLIAFFDSPAQARTATEALSAAGFTFPPTTQLISTSTGTSETTDHVKSDVPTSPGQDLLPTNSLSMAVATAQRVQLSPLLDEVAPTGIDNPVQNEPAARAVADPGLDSIPGGLRGALTGWGFSGDAIAASEDQINQGRALLTVELIEHDTLPRAMEILQSAGADRILDSKSSTSVS